MAVANRETASVREGFLVTGAKDVQTRIAFANGVFFRDFDISSSKQLVRMFAIKVSDFIVGSKLHHFDIEVLEVLNQQLLPCITNEIHDGVVVASFIGTAVVVKATAFELVEVILTHSIVCFFRGRILLWIYFCVKVALVIGESLCDDKHNLHSFL